MTRDLQNIGSYVLCGASQRDVEPALELLDPYMEWKPTRQSKVNVPLPTDSEVGRFVRPVQLISKHGAKWRWTDFLNDEVLPDVITRSKKPWSFLDAFGGTGIITFMAAEGDWTDSLANVYYNDFGSETANLMRTVKAQPEAVIVGIKMILSDPKIYKNLWGDGFYAIKELSQASPNPNLRAAAYILRMKLSFGAKGDNPSMDYGQDGYGKSLRKAENTIDAVREWSAMLQGVTLWKKHFRDAIRDFNAQEQGVNRIVFLDPPYIGCQSGEQYEVQMPEAEHRELAEIIRRRESTYIVTHLDNPEYRSIYGNADAEWNITARYTLVSKGHEQKFNEVTAVWYGK